MTRQGRFLTKMTDVIDFLFVMAYVRFLSLGNPVIDYHQCVGCKPQADPGCPQRQCSKIALQLYKFEFFANFKNKTLIFLFVFGEIDYFLKQNDDQSNKGD